MFLVFRTSSAALVLLATLLVAGSTFAGEEEEIDEDGDGFTESEGDCDDDEATIYPGAPEFCDEEDNNCDGEVDADDDEYVGDDADGDGDLASDCGGTDCNDLDASVTDLDVDGDGTSSCDGDCDDTDTNVDPNTEEICGDGLDNDCDGDCADVDPDPDCDDGIDNLDLDSDGAISEDCGGPDCDDTNPSIDPENPEEGATCIDQIDNDCDCPGDTDGDGVECGQGDEGVDGQDEDCFTAPEADAGEGQQDRYLGGVSVALLDASGTTDDNADDVLTYTWTVTPEVDYSGIEWTLVSDPASPYAYLRFSADAANEDVTWNFIATVVVGDGVHETSPDDENASTTVTFFRPTFYAEVGCAHARRSGGSAAALLTILLGLFGVVRRRN